MIFTALRDIALFPILGKPFIFYSGIFTLISFLFTASIGFLNHKGIHRIPFKWHPVMAVTSITLAVIHGFLGILIYF